jgi:hypothetical protein
VWRTGRDVSLKLLTLDDACHFLVYANFILTVFAHIIPCGIFRELTELYKSNAAAMIRLCAAEP